MNQKPRLEINPPVFFTSAAFILGLVIFAAAMPDTLQRLFSSVQNWIFQNVSWFYMLTVAIILIATLYAALSRFGEIKLGPDHSEPDYRDPAWYSMLFAAGMGIGLMFFGVAEPVMHFLDPPTGEGGTAAAARQALGITFFHWGLHAWAIYAIVALILAYFSFRQGLPLTLRSALYPMLGDRIYGPIGHAVDIFAIIGTVFGVATSLGVGVSQINTGLNYLFGVPVGEGVQVILIILAVSLATLSAASGVNKGIKILSELNMVLAILLMLFVMFVGPTVFLLQTFIENTGVYLSGIVSRTFNLYAYEPSDWIGGWTVFYWGWWISWSPFVGVFIARISRGRTIRQFVGGVLLMPTGFTFMWMTVFGDTAIHMILAQGMSDLADTVSADETMALFVFLEKLPWSTVMSTLAVAMVLVFFVTSADSGALVVDQLAAGGVENPPVWQRIFWSVVMGAAAIVLLLADGLAALQTATIATALPFSIILLIAIWGLFKALRLDLMKRNLRSRRLSRGSASVASETWQERLRNMVLMPRRRHVERFINEIVRVAMTEVSEELRKQGYEARIEESDGAPLTLVVPHGDKLDFSYSVHSIEVKRPSLTPEELADDEESRYYRAEVHLGEGGQDYDIMGWSRDQIIGDVLDQYERHRHYLRLTH
ncbi:MAG TPA: choline BCCT transporter BetT [Pusillimonas sp.]|uniref:BCCT family transporter n=1 Tax=Pusillimonas sp. TaxID=3040095 RepID=UPI002B74EFC4|nr:choline BCCT transporter BetT [Pusillimonas sp.]HUH86672.1 choline BCCT transporter BetT [Pusillimonas sp.]